MCYLFNLQSHDVVNELKYGVHHQFNVFTTLFNVMVVELLYDSNSLFASSQLETMNFDSNENNSSSESELQTLTNCSSSTV